MKYWEIIAGNLSAAGWTLGYAALSRKTAGVLGGRCILR
jgi:hypothetical protein